MKIVKQSWKYYNPFLQLDSMNYAKMIRIVEGSARTCYQSANDSEKSEQFVKNLIKRKHLSPLEHINISLTITTDRAVLAELTRHRLATFSVESQRFVKYKEVSYILPVWYADYVDGKSQDVYLGAEYLYWKESCERAEKDYRHLIEKYNCTPQKARMVLNNSVAVNLIVTANLREWRHILSLRTKMDNNPQMKDLMTSILVKFEKDMPIFFEDILEK